MMRQSRDAPVHFAIEVHAVNPVPPVGFESTIEIMKGDTAHACRTHVK